MAVLCIVSPGCYVGSLASTTGSRQGGRWSIERHQQVHVGERVNFSFVLRERYKAERVNAAGLADYCAFEFGADRFDVDVDEYGCFRAQYTFSELVEGQEITVAATAYRQVGERDRVKVGGRWFKPDDAKDRADEMIASDKIVLTAYQAGVDLILPHQANEYDFSTAQMVFRRVAGEVSVVFLEESGQAGFHVEAEHNGEWRVTYTPIAGQLNTDGTTDVVFSVYDRAGNRHRLTTTLDTP